MKFHPLPLEGAFCIELDMLEDERGFFARTFCRKEFHLQGLNPHLEQCSLSFNKQRKTLRGMHYQIAPYEEAKLVTCIQGAIYDVIIDMRPSSKTFLEWTSVELTAENGKALYVPEGFAHGFQTLMGNTKVFYQISQAFVPGSARGVRWNDPHFSLEWPYREGLIISQKDQNYPDFANEENLSRKGC